MNPFTDTLLKQIRNKSVVEFVTAWDQLEALVIRVYRSKEASADDEAELAQLRARLAEAYAPWRSALDPYWRRTTVAGEATRDDPFERLLAHRAASDFVRNWTAMQTLPAARQAINEWLVSILREQHRK